MTTNAQLLARARSSIREVERFVYRELSVADSPEDVSSARNIQRLTVGLRRLLDNYHCVGDPRTAPPATHKEE